ncbi:MAG TPA: hypothetical protein VMJ35_15170 [Dongiaceae bacterium]|nr:hypothetical protein [Dongiaceae bacterium]
MANTKIKPNFAVSEELASPDAGRSEHGGLLDSWKEIASFLGREVRTAQRWEKSEQLPVHRHIHRKNGTVYAFKAELEAWRNSRSQRPTLLPQSSEARPTTQKGSQNEPPRFQPRRATFVWNDGTVQTVILLCPDSLFLPDALPSLETPAVSSDPNVLQIRHPDTRTSVPQVRAGNGRFV